MQRAGDVDAARSGPESRKHGDSNRGWRVWHFFRRHLLTFVLTAIVGAGVMMAQSQDLDFYGGNKQRLKGVATYSYGWPTIALRRSVPHDFGASWRNPNAPDQRKVGHIWHLGPAVIDAATSLLLVASAVICGEMFSRRRSAPLQFRLSHLLQATLIVAILLMYHRHEFGSNHLYRSYSYSYPPLRLYTFPWYTTYSIYLGMACVLAVALTGITTGIRRLRR